jgi:two-component system phosphate regulon response regulator PhoB
MSVDLRKRVLLADDDAALRRLIRATFSEAEFVLLQAADGTEALSLAQEQHPSVVLLDVNMPGLDGFEVCRRLKGDSATSDIKVVMLTARGADADRREAHRAGADEYIVKPFSPIQLLDKVYALLG